MSAKSESSERPSFWSSIPSWKAEGIFVLVGLLGFVLGHGAWGWGIGVFCFLNFVAITRVRVPTFYMSLGDSSAETLSERNHELAGALRELITETERDIPHLPGAVGDHLAVEVRKARKVLDSKHQVGVRA